MFMVFPAPARIFPLLLTLCWLTVALPAQSGEEEPLWPDIKKPVQSDETSVRLLSLNVKARGGRALSSVTCIEKSGQMIEGRISCHITRLHVKPDNLRQSTTSSRLGFDYKETVVFNGSTAWHQTCFPERSRPSNLSEFEEQLFALESLIPFLATEWKTEGLVFHYLGKSQYAGKPSYRVHAWGPGNLRFEMHFDQETFHIINYSHPYKIGDETILVDRTPTQLVRAAGALWENGYKLHIRGNAFKQVSYESVIPQTEWPENAFSKPAVREHWLRR